MDILSKWLIKLILIDHKNSEKERDTKTKQKHKSFVYICLIFMFIIYFLGSGALSGKMLLERIVENDKIDDILGQVRLSKG